MRDAIIRIRVQEADALTMEADVLALKYAQALYGIDQAVAYRLVDAGLELNSMLPETNEHRLVPGHGSLGSRYALFVGIPDLLRVDYAELRLLASRTFEILADESVQVRHLVTTIHGPGFGLDEVEAFKAQLAGMLDAIAKERVPRDLTLVTIVEGNSGRARRLTDILAREIPGGVLGRHGRHSPDASNSSHLQKTSGIEADHKPRVFVAMSFDEAMDDVFHYGIQNAVHSAGFVCERADLAIFTGDILEWVKQRIASADLVIADLSEANPNVYLELGYAWGCQRSTVLVVRDEDHLQFDVRGQRCLIYKKIKDLETLLSAELKGLAARPAS
jgi:hypothetical protein